ncbi:restriction endonuclease subunit S [Paracoccus sp. S3-43]|uniref:restriction endonuclease subunit S n=1 Tax=Paracoccus sp. S3-43 TaxID=3030011 RepID=UPI0023B00C92|nr:restriction endonuclease subunit S [Paracoccus sp. S3-43]WEF24301.1 restriction endonuclease subunit S [Paracoccus sp. S3-43]
MNNHAHILSGRGDIETSFLRSWLNSVDWMQYVSGSTRLKLTQAGMSGVEIPLPPLPEQRRIVRKLDTLSARSTTARTHLHAIEKLVERYRTAVLEAAFRAEWDAGCDTTIASCLEHAETGLVRSKAEQTAGEGHPYIRMNHYDLAGRWNDRDLTYVAATSAEFDRYQLRADDLLFNTRNSAELVGKVAIWPEGKDGYLFNNNLLRMRFSEDVVPAFAFWQMSSPPFRRYIEGFISATTSVAAIYQRSLMAAPFWVPDPDEQRKVLRRIETAFAKIDRLAAEAAKALKLLGRLDQRILAKAFAGELVPQDPSDEPAETLLARIREAHAAAPKARRGRKARA